MTLPGDIEIIRTIRETAGDIVFVGINAAAIVCTVLWQCWS